MYTRLTTRQLQRTLTVRCQKRGAATLKYRRLNARKPTERVVFLMTTDELADLDGWGVPAGMQSRAEAIRTLIQKGLAVARQDAEKGGDGAQAS